MNGQASSSQSTVMMDAPSINASSLMKRFPVIENSSTMISVQPMYTNEPAAKLEKIISVSAPELDRSIPTTTPIGEAIEKVNTSQRQILKSFGKVLTREIPSELEAAPLWIRMAAIILMTYCMLPYKPKASPSKTACTERAIISTNGVMLGQQDVFLVIS